VKVDTAQLVGSPPPLLDAALALSTMEGRLLADDVSKQTHDSILAQIAAPQKPARGADASMIAGLLLGSPEFQKR
jgi:hypothetical protein